MNQRRRKRGRPQKVGSIRDVVLTIRLTPKERRMIDGAAERDRIPVSIWARAVLLRTAEKGGRK